MMCTVQVLLMSDVVRREGLPQVDRALPPRNICRRLFAEDDGAQRRAQFLASVQDDMEKENRERWNFDFRTGTPLTGRYQWMPVCPAESPKESVQNKSCRKTASDRSSSSKSPKQRNKIGKTTTQSKITDFLFRRKRHRTVEECPVARLKSRRSEQPLRSAAVN